MAFYVNFLLKFKIIVIDTIVPLNYMISMRLYYSEMSRNIKENNFVGSSGYIKKGRNHNRTPES